MIDTQAKPLAIFGGTFDPIHCGHIHLACTAHQKLDLDTIYFLPTNNTPAHRQPPQVSQQHRHTMVNLCCQQYPYLKIDTTELEQKKKTYTIDTVKTMRSKIGQRSQIFLIGEDAFNQLDQWHHWQELLNYTHIVIIPRQPSKPPSKKLSQWLKQYQCHTTKPLHQYASGYIYQLNTATLEISSSKIRALIKQHQPIDKLLPDTVYHYINQHHLYHAA